MAVSRFLVCDIETVGLVEAKDWLEPLSAPSNYKKPEAIDAYIKDAEAERLQKLALDPDCNRIVAFGWVDTDGGEPMVHLASNDFEERAGLELFANVYRQKPDTRLITFNGRKFDLPVLMRRAMYLDVKFPILNVDRYRSEHIDLYQKLTQNYDISAHSLKFYAKRFGFTTLDKVSGADIGRLVAENTKESWQQVYDHVLSDVGLTHALAARLGYVKLAQSAVA